MSSLLARVEVLRAVHRAGASRAVAERAESIIRGLGLVRLEDNIVAAVASLRPVDLRTLDAIDLATALSLLPALPGFITYDARLAAAARAAGLTVQVPR